MLILGEMQQNSGARGRRVAGGREFRKNRDNVSVFCGGRAELQGWPESSRMLGVHKRYSNQALRKHGSMSTTEFWRYLNFLLTLIISGRGSKHLFMHLPNPKLLS